MASMVHWVPVGTEAKRPEGPVALDRPLSVLELPTRRALRRRSGRRTAVRSHIALRATDKLDGSSYALYNLSVDGFLCFAESPLWPGRRTRIELTLPFDRLDSIVASIECIDMVPMGQRVGNRMRFVDLTPHQRARLDAVVHLTRRFAPAGK